MIELEVGTVQAELAAEICRRAADAFKLEAKACQLDADHPWLGDSQRIQLRIEASVMFKIARVMSALEGSFRGVPIRPGAHPVDGEGEPT